MDKLIVDAETLRDQFEDCREAVHDGKAWWITERPIQWAWKVREGEATWIADDARPLPCCDDKSDPCLRCKPEPTGLLMPCPRCNGLGIRQFDGFDGPCYEICTSCNDGMVDDQTAREIERMIEMAHDQADPEAEDDSCNEELLLDMAAAWDHSYVESREQSDWDDSYTWVPTQTPEPTLPEMIAVEITMYRQMRTPFGDLMADRIEGLLTVVNALDAKTIEDYHDRRAAMIGPNYP